MDIIKPGAKSEDSYGSKLPFIRYVIYVLASYAMIRYFLFPESGLAYESGYYLFNTRLGFQGIPILFLIFIYIKAYIKSRIIGIKKEFQSVVDGFDMKIGIKGFESKKNYFRELDAEYNILQRTSNTRQRRKAIESELSAGLFILQRFKKEVADEENILNQLNIIGLKLSEAKGKIFIGKNIYIKIAVFLSMLVIVITLLFV